MRLRLTAAWLGQSVSIYEIKALSAEARSSMRVARLLSRQLSPRYLTNPLHLGPGQQKDMAPACDLVPGTPAEKVLADRAYDADSLHDLIYQQGGEPVVPPRRHRNYQHRYDHIADKQRWGIEGSFAKLKQ